MRRERSCALVVGLVLAAGAVCPVRAGAASAMRAEIDPATGALRSEPSPAPPEVTPSTAPSTAHEAAGENPVEEPAPGGGVMVDLKGRFVRPLVVRRAPDGTVRAEHETSSGTR